MAGKDGGKKKPLKKAKGDDKVETDEDLAFKEKQKEQQKALQDLKAGIKSGKPMGTGGMKKSK
ncbi:tma7 [Acrasis kona]|uniref:Tma7 n=1 Tax=Acrasis kona TaxID=1008807 RepID=A0AAW2YQT4_9EUKA